MELALCYVNKKKFDKARAHYEISIEMATRCRARFIPAAVAGDLQNPIDLLEAKLYTPRSWDAEFWRQFAALVSGSPSSAIQL
jgi:hypothetical protein